MKAIVINREISRSEILRIRHFVDKAGEAVLYNRSNMDLPKDIENLVSTQRFNIDNDFKAALNKELFNYVINFGDKEFKGKPFVQWLKFENTSLWYYFKYRVFFFLRNLLYEAGEIDKFFNAGIYEKILWFSESNESIIKFIKNDDSIEIQTPAKENGTSSLLLLQYGIFLFVRFMIGFFQVKYSKREHHIISRPYNNQFILKKSDLSKVQDDGFLSYLLQKGKNIFKILVQVDVPKKTMRDFNLFQKTFWSNHFNRKRIYVEYVFLSGFLKRHIKKKVKALSEHFYDSISEISEEKSLSNRDREILSYIHSNHSFTKLVLFRYFSYCKFFSSVKIKTLTCTDENYPEIKAIVDAAKSAGVKTFAIQHGIIHSFNPAYHFTQKDRKNYHPMPDYTLVWGHKWKRKLIENNYPPESVEVVGQIRTDIIPSLLANKDKFEGISPTSKTTILFASQPQRDEAARTKAMSDVFIAASQLEDVHLVVKPHPAEKSDSYFNKLAKEANCKNYEIIRDVDLYVLLSKVNVVITCFSTVGSEAIYFNKPLITIDYMKEDIQGYYKDGVAYRATSETELLELIKKLLNGNLTVNLDSYNKYISENAYKIDGNVSERCLNVIMQKSQ